MAIYKEFNEESLCEIFDFFPKSSTFRYSDAAIDALSNDEEKKNRLRESRKIFDYDENKIRRI